MLLAASAAARPTTVAGPNQGGEKPKPAPVEITVYAAASLRDALTAIGTEYEKAHAAKLVFNFGSSGDLSRQIIAANKADIFFSADEKEMDRVAAANLIEAGTRSSPLSNQLVVIETVDPKSPDASIFKTPFSVEQLTGPGVKRLSLANVDTVPAGRYAKEWLEKRNAWSQLAERVLPGVDVRAALAAVESGGAQAGIVYRTDAAQSKRVKVAFAVPLDEGPKIAYALAVMKGRTRAAEAKALAEHLTSHAALDVFQRYGFVLPPPSVPPKKEIEKREPAPVH
jgi:molybdate transport system substrate-binding protein